MNCTVSHNVSDFSPGSLAIQQVPQAMTFEIGSRIGLGRAEETFNLVKPLVKKTRFKEVTRFVFYRARGTSFSRAKFFLIELDG